ncbi:MAG: TlpA family protein disulfide reductase [Microscillaceae bacterium]|nr:TlpA family protein disulfide reductase [Microscillaceae bacterium]MDW8460627.1 TlpA disulfide reductase family protein [Cytophagales bacterium]
MKNTNAKLVALLPIIVFIVFFTIAFLSLQDATSQPPKIGETAPEIALPNQDGKTIKLSEFKNKKYVLVDFWASWCRPCREENPYVVSAYEKYKNKDFVVLSVSLDNDRQKWLEAIKKDKLNWQWHVSDLLSEQRGEVSKKYGVKSIPANFLIDKKGKVVAMNLRGEELEKTLKKVIGS